MMYENKIINQLTAIESCVPAFTQVHPVKNDLQQIQALSDGLSITFYLLHSIYRLVILKTMNTLQHTSTH